jgi:hypothetical protein
MFGLTSLQVDEFSLLVFGVNLLPDSNGRLSADAVDENGGEPDAENSGSGVDEKDGENDPREGGANPKNKIHENGNKYRQFILCNWINFKSNFKSKTLKIRNL